jgi:hypothetical protein
MAKIAMIPLYSVESLDCSVIEVGRGMVGAGGDNYLCGHCGFLILENFNPSLIYGNPIYRCGFCDNLNEMPARTASQP